MIVLEYAMRSRTISLRLESHGCFHSAMRNLFRRASNQKNEKKFP